jgi:hypothetical protein
MGDTGFDPNGKNILQQARISWGFICQKVDSNNEIEGTVG